MVDANKGCILNSCVRKEASQPNVPKKNCQETNHQPLKGEYEQAKRMWILMTDCDKKAGNPMHQTAHKESMSIWQSKTRTHNPNTKNQESGHGKHTKAAREKSNRKGKALQPVPSHKTTWKHQFQWQPRADEYLGALIWAWDCPNLGILILELTIYCNKGKTDTKANGHSDRNPRTNCMQILTNEINETVQT